jgi:molybdate transport system ATP-binding protein
MTDPALVAQFAGRLGRLEIDVELTAEAGRTLVLVGESGAGKTTILNTLAGVLHPERGMIRVDGITYFASDQGINVPAHARTVGYVFQNYALFPHLRVFENVAFGLAAQGFPRAHIQTRVRETLEHLGIADLSERRPASLSGGQQQRVALARALVLRSRLLLLDEPLSALDLQTRREIRGELLRLLRILPCVTLLVTHNPLEAVVFGDTIAVVEAGRIIQLGPRDELLRRPRSRYVAELMGLNLFHGRVVSRDSSGLIEIDTAEGSVYVVDAGEGDEVFVVVDPREITLHAERPAGTAQNVFAGSIVQLIPEPPLGERIRAVLDTRPPLVAEITAHAVGALGLHEGQTVYAAFKATAARAYR